VASLALGWVNEGRQGRELRRLFANYLSPELVEELAGDPARASLGGERRELSVLFTDIVGFTQFSERLAPTELSAFLREYLGPMTRVVLDHAGYVDKYIGDAIMAVYGAPVAEARHAENACRTAIALHAALGPLRPVAQSYGIELAIGVGVNSGEMVVGNLGSAERFDYTVLGDSVNFASRIEGLTRHYRVFCLIGPRTRALAGPAFTTRSVAAVRVKGKAETIEIFELCTGPNGTIVAYDDVATFDAARQAWIAGDFAAAERMFEAFLGKNPHDHVSRLYLEALAGHRGVVPAGWDGVFEHREK
jgi:adenylate cyclase